MNIILSILIALSTLFAPASQPASPAHLSPVANVTAITAAQAAPARCEEDMPCWNCKDMGNYICGPTAQLATEAWESFSTDGFTEDELSQAFSATYRGTTTHETLADGHEWYLIPSKINPKLNHVFELEFGTTR